MPKFHRNQCAYSAWDTVIHALDDAESLLNKDTDLYLELMQEIAREALRRFSDIYEGRNNGDPSVNKPG